MTVVVDRVDQRVSRCFAHQLGCTVKLLLGKSRISSCNSKTPAVAAPLSQADVWGPAVSGQWKLSCYGHWRVSQVPRQFLSVWGIWGQRSLVQNEMGKRNDCWKLTERDLQSRCCLRLKRNDTVPNLTCYRICVSHGLFQNPTPNPPPPKKKKKDDEGSNTNATVFKKLRQR